MEMLPNGQVRHRGRRAILAVEEQLGGRVGRGGLCPAGAEQRRRRGHLRDQLAGAASHTSAHTSRSSTYTYTYASSRQAAAQHNDWHTAKHMAHTAQDGGKRLCQDSSTRLLPPPRSARIVSTASLTTGSHATECSADVLHRRQALWPGARPADPWTAAPAHAAAAPADTAHPQAELDAVHGRSALCPPPRASSPRVVPCSSPPPRCPHRHAGCACRPSAWTCRPARQPTR